MNRTANVSVLIAGILVLLAGCAVALFVDLDGPGLAGVAAGVALGLLNLAVGWLIATRALKRGMQSALVTLLGGFFVRLVVLCVLIFAFHAIEAVDEVAFALSFMVCFFVYVALEVVLVERTLQSRRRAV